MNHWLLKSEPDVFGIEDLARAAAVLKPAFDANRNAPAIALLMAQLKLGAGQSADAMALFEKTYQSYPTYAPAILRYAQALIETGKPDVARQVLLASGNVLGRLGHRCSSWSVGP